MKRIPFVLASIGTVLWLSVEAGRFYHIPFVFPLMIFVLVYVVTYFVIVAYNPPKK